MNVNYAYLENITVKGNSASKGGGLFSQNSNLDLISSLIVENALTGQDDGGGIYLSENGLVKIINCTVANNTIFDGRNGPGMSMNYWNNSDSVLVSLIVFLQK